MARARTGWQAWFEASANLLRRLRMVIDRPQTGPKVGPSAVGQRPRTIEDQPSPGAFVLNLATAGVSPQQDQACEFEPWWLPRTLRRRGELTLIEDNGRGARGGTRRASCLACARPRIGIPLNASCTPCGRWVVQVKNQSCRRVAIPIRMTVHEVLGLSFDHESCTSTRPRAA